MLGRRTAAASCSNICITAPTSGKSLPVRASSRRIMRFIARSKGDMRMLRATAVDWLPRRCSCAIARVNASLTSPVCMSITSAICRGDQRIAYLSVTMRFTCTLCPLMNSHSGASCSLSASGRSTNPFQSSSRLPAFLAAFRCASAESLTARRMFSRRDASSICT